MHRSFWAHGFLAALSTALLLAPGPALGADSTASSESSDTSAPDSASADAPRGASESSDSPDRDEPATDEAGESDTAAPTDSADDSKSDSPSPENRRQAHLRIEALTDFPVQVGAGALFEFPGALRLSTSVGVLPKGYLKVSNDVLVPMVDSYTQASANLVEDVLQSSLVWRTHLGLRPFPKLGFYIHTGYALVTLGGTATSAGEFIDFVETDIDPEEAEERFRNEFADEELQVHSTLHQWDIEIGWDWRLAEHLRLRTALAWSYTFAASTTMEAQFEADRRQVQATIDTMESAGEAYLNDTYRTSIHPPYLNLSLGWRFF